MTALKVMKRCAAACWDVLSGCGCKVLVHMQAHKWLCEREGKHKDNPRGRLFYLALPPSVYPEVVQGIKENCTGVQTGDGGFLRIIAEKPFGKVIS